MPRMLRRPALAAALVCLLAGPAHAYGTFVCVAPDGQEVCTIDTGTETNFAPKDRCNASCKACSGRCDAIRRYAPQSGHWSQTWQGTPGIGDNNIMVPGGNLQDDARTILNDGLVSPGTAPAKP